MECKVFADPGTITGSIGVLGGKFNIAPALAKLGVTSEGVFEGTNVEMFDAFLVGFDRAEHHGRGRRHAEILRHTHHANPFIGFNLARADAFAHALN